MKITARTGIKGQVVQKIINPPDSIYFIGIAGTAMAGVAGVLKSLGYNVTGSDANFYPPMSDQLKETNIPLLKDYDKSRITDQLQLVVIGNSIFPKNEEAQAVLNSDIPYVSLPEMIYSALIFQKKCLSISGTHGKTTTSSLMAWIIQSAGQDPSFLIGGIPNNFNKSFNKTDSNWFVIEGDEYDTAFFDKRPKFIHYKPFCSIITSIEFDHVDIYDSIEKVKDSFKLLISSMPEEGILVVNGEDKNIQDILPHSSCKRIIKYGIKSGDYQIQDRVPCNSDDLHSFYIKEPTGERVLVYMSVFGLHNAMNAVSAYALARELGFKSEGIIKGLGSFTGVRRRFQILDQYKEACLIEDFAHHPTAAKSTLIAIQERFPEHKIIVVFEPRSASSRRNVFQKQYVESFSLASSIYIAPPYKEQEIQKEERLSTATLIQDLKTRGCSAFHIENVQTTAQEIVNNIQTPSVIVIMSNGPFEGMHSHIKNNLTQRFSNSSS